MDISRLYALLDKDFSQNDYQSALRHLLYWRSEAAAENDKRALLTLTNELIGLYRKTAKKDEALTAAAEALSLIEQTQTADTAGAATVYINAATAYKAFGKAAEALPLFDKAKRLYEKYLDKSDDKWGALYNNMALAYADAGDYAAAEDCYTKALAHNEHAENGKADSAVTYLNMADLVLQKYDVEHTENLDILAAAGEKITSLCDNAWHLLQDASLIHDGYYAFVCEKCAAGFGFHGQYERQRVLEQTAARIYGEYNDHEGT